jgi:large repetitive protein
MFQNTRKAWESSKMISGIRRGHGPLAFALRLAIIFGFSASLLLLPPRAPAQASQLTANPSLEIFSGPTGTVTFTITVPAGTTLGSVSVLTFGAPNRDYTPVASGTTCPNVVNGTCTVEVQFQPTEPGRRQGIVMLSDPSGKSLLNISLDAAGNQPLTGFGPGVITTFAGSASGGGNGPTVNTPLAGPTSITADGFGNRYIADQKGNKVVKVTPAGVASTFAGTGTAGYSGDSGPAASATLNGPMSVLVDGAGFVFIADTGNNVVRMVDNNGNISTYAGQFYLAGSTPPAVCPGATEPMGDGCPGNRIVLNAPVDLVFCHAQNLHIADKGNNRVRTIDRVSYDTFTQVGNGVAGYNGDGELNTSAELNGPTGMAMDAANYIYVADSGNHIIRKTLLTGTTPNPIATVAGTPGSAGNSGDGSAAISAQLNNPHGIQVDPAGDIYISDPSSQVIREVNIATGKISTIAGTTSAGYTGDSGSAAAAQLNAPYGMLLDESGNLYVADSQNGAVRKIDLADAPALTFGSTMVGATSSAQDVTVINLGVSALNLGAIAAPANFSLAGADTSCGLTSQSLNPGQSCVLSVEFVPTAAGTMTGNIALADNANPATETIALSGTAAAQAPAETYTLTANSTTLSMSPGGSATAMLTLNSTNYAGTVSFATAVTSTTGTPTNVTVTATPVTLASGGSGTSTVTISANASAENHATSSPWNNGGGVVFCAALIGLPFALRRKRLVVGLTVLLAIAAAGVMTACGGGSSMPHTQAARVYTVTLTPTAATPSGSATVTNPSAVSIQVTVQ